MRNLFNHVVFVIALVPLGCSSGVPTYPVSGKIELAGGDVKVLAGSHVEIARVDDTKLRASGEIQADGSFKLQTNHAGGILDGVHEGNYQVRIIPSDENKNARGVVATRFLQFATSGLTIRVPAGGPVTIALASR